MIAQHIVQHSLTKNATPTKSVKQSLTMAIETNVFSLIVGAFLLVCLFFFQPNVAPLSILQVGKSGQFESFEMHTQHTSNTTCFESCVFSPIFAFFLQLSREPVPVDIGGLRSGGEVARAAIAALELSAKLHRVITSADVRLFVILRKEALKIVADSSFDVHNEKSNVLIGALDDFSLKISKNDEPCLLVELVDEFFEKASFSAVPSLSSHYEDDKHGFPLISPTSLNSLAAPTFKPIFEQGIFQLLVLVTNSPEPFYEAQRKFWRQFAIKSPRVHVIFLNDNPGVEATKMPHLIDNDLFIPGGAGVTPGILIKIMKALEFLRPRLNRYRFVLKTNLSSFWVWALLLRWIENGGVSVPTYAGVDFTIDGGVRAASGAGLLMSHDVVQELLNNQDLLDYGRVDDNAIAYLMAHLGHKVQPMPRTDFIQSCTGKGVKSGRWPPAQEEFHFRIKCENRLVDDSALFSHMYNKYYG